MKVLIACESSERVKKEFLLLGHDAHSCDFKAGEQGLPNHHQCDVRELLQSEWVRSLDMLIAHPDCTRLGNSGVRWLKDNPDRMNQMVKDVEFFNWLLHLNIPHIALENPIQHKYARQYIRMYDQIIHPYYFDEDTKERKATCLWLVNLPPLMARFTGGEGIKQTIWREPPSKERKTNRSRTFVGIAKAMATQWSRYVQNNNDRYKP